MRNERTPRTLAECQFTVGHAEVCRRSGYWADIAIAVVAAFVIVAFAVGCVS